MRPRQRDPPRSPEHATSSRRKADPMPMPAGCLSLCRRYGYAPPRTSPVAPHEPLTPRQKGESSSCIRFHPSLIPARPGPDEKASGRLARSYPDARGRTSPHDVVPKRARSYPGALPRYDLAPQGTTWRHKVRPGATRYDRARSGRAESPAPARQHPHPRTRRTRSRSFPRQVHKPMRILLMEVLTENDPESLPSFPAQPCAPGPPLCSQPSPR